MLNYSKINNYLVVLLVVFCGLFFGLLLSFGKTDILKMVAKTIIAPEKTGFIIAGGEKYEFALPNNSVLIEENSKYKKYITLTIGNRLYDNYYHKELTSFGWKFVEQLGSGYIYQKDNATLVSTRRRVYHRMEEITFSVQIRSDDAEKVVAVNH